MPTTLCTRKGWLKPFKSSSPTETASATSSTLASRRSATRVWPSSAAAQSRAAWFVTGGVLEGQSNRRPSRLRSVDYWKDFDLKLSVKIMSGQSPRIFFRRTWQGYFVTHIPADGKWHNVFITAHGSKLRATIDGKAAPVENSAEDDAEHTMGNLELVVHDGNALFKDISLRPR